MQAQTKILVRRMAMLRALHKGEDPRQVGEAFGMKPKQVSNTLAGLAKLGLVDVERETPREGTPAYITHRNVYSLSDVGRATMARLDDV